MQEPLAWCAIHTNSGTQRLPLGTPMIVGGTLRPLQLPLGMARGFPPGHTNGVTQILHPARAGVSHSQQA